MSDTSGISICFGNVQDSVLLENAKLALRDMGAKWSDKIQIDTSHFVCTTVAATPPWAGAARNTSGAPGVQYRKALQLSIPIVQPHWILACHAEKRFAHEVSSKYIFLIFFRMVPIGSFYLGASSAESVTSVESKRKSIGIINPGIKFPPSSSSSFPPGPGASHANPAAIQPDIERRGSRPIEDQSSLKGKWNQDDESNRRRAAVAISNIDVPAPPFVEKEMTASRSSLDDLGDDDDDDVGDIVDIPLN